MTVPRSKTPSYTMSPAAIAQHRALRALARARMVGDAPREFATVRIDRRMRDAADAVRDDGESLAAVVTEAVAREVERRGGEAPED